MKIFIAKFIVIFLFVTTAFALEKTGQNTLLKTTLLDVNFYDATIEVEFYLADDNGQAFLMVLAEDVGQANFFRGLDHGLNKVVVNVQRDRYKASKKTTETVKLSVFHDVRSPFWTKEINLQIDWPGPEFLSNIIGNSSVSYFDYSSVGMVSIYRSAHNAKKIYEDILRAGIPITHARIIGMPRPDIISENLSIRFGIDNDPAAVKEIISRLLQAGHKIADIGSGGVEKKLHFDDTIVITYTGKSRLDDNMLVRLKNNVLSDKEFYTLAGIDAPNLDDYIQRQYKMAYDLIDHGSKANLNKAKNIIDEIISKDPDFVGAYIELARYKMKTMGISQETFIDAEKSLLLATEIDPEHADARVLLGYVYTYQERYEEAEAEYRHAEKAGTDNSWLYANWGLNDEKQNKNEQAIEKYTRVLLKPRNHDRNDRVMQWTKSHLFPLLLETGKYSEADRYYTRYINAFPADSCLLLKQAENTLFNLGQYEKAIKQNIQAAKKGCSKNSVSLSVAYYLKWFHNSAAGLNTKDGTFRQAEAMAPNDAELFHSLASSAFTSALIDVLVNKGKAINGMNAEGYTALLLSIYAQDHDAAKRLVKSGADINLANPENKLTPLVMAVIKQDIEMVRFLLAHDANAEVALPNGVSLYAWAKSNGLSEISNALGGKKSI